MRCDDPSLANLATGNGRGLEGDAPRICSTSTEGAAICRKLPSRTRCTFGPPLPAEEAGCEAAVSNGFAFASSCIRRSAFSTAENTCPIGMFVLKGEQDVKTARLGWHWVLLAARLDLPCPTLSGSRFSGLLDTPDRRKLSAKTFCSGRHRWWCSKLS